MDLTGTDALPLDTPVRPYSRHTSRRSTTDAQIVRPYSGYTSRRSTTDAQIVRPYSRHTSRRSTTDAQVVRPYSRHTFRVIPTAEAGNICLNCFAVRK